MARKKRKITFHYLKINNEELNIIDVYNNLVTAIVRLGKPDRKIEQGFHKFYLIDSCENIRLKKKIVFKNASYNFRPKLIDNITISERDSPKELGEGERQKTHIITKIVDEEILLIAEKSFYGVNINQIIKYLNHFTYLLDLDENFTFYYETIAKDNFIEEIENLERITYADVIVDKQLLGSEALNFSSRINEVKHEITVTIKAKRENNIENIIRDVYAKLNGGESHINKIRIKGRNLENNEVVINTDFIERQEFIMCDYNQETGEISTPDAFIELNSIIENF